MSTQVDHIALIISQDPIHADLLKYNDLFELENLKTSKSKKSSLESKTKQQEIEEQLKQVGKDNSKTVHVFSNKKNSRNRRRLDSAPSFENGDENDYNGDVNFTLSGYLHTIHSFRQYVMTQRQQQQQLVAPKSISDQTNETSHKLPLLAKIFSNPNNQNENNNNVEEGNNKTSEVEVCLSINN